LSTFSAKVSTKSVVKAIVPADEGRVKLSFPSLIRIEGLINVLFVRVCSSSFKTILSVSVKSVVARVISVDKFFPAIVVVFNTTSSSIAIFFHSLF